MLNIAAGLQPCRWQFNSYNFTVLDIKLIRDQPDFVRQRLATRGAGDEANIDELFWPTEAVGLRLQKKNS